MSESHDPYWKLRPEPVTPEDEICHCADDPPIVLQDHLSPLPIACLRCNGEVPPERIGFTAAISDELASWRSFHRAFLSLELDSGEYESWAQVQLSDAASPVNVRGLAAVARLNEFRRAYFWWFVDSTANDFRPLVNCPRCGRELSPAYGRQVCESCSIVVPEA